MIWPKISFFKQSQIRLLIFVALQLWSNNAIAPQYCHGIPQLLHISIWHQNVTFYQGSNGGPPSHTFTPDLSNSWLLPKCCKFCHCNCKEEMVYNDSHPLDHKINNLNEVKLVHLVEHYIEDCIKSHYITQSHKPFPRKILNSNLNILWHIWPQNSTLVHLWKSL